MFKSLKRKLRERKEDKALTPPSVSEQSLIDNLVKKFELLQTPSLDQDPANIEWRKNLSELKNNVLKRDPRNFLRWQMIKFTMYTGDIDYIKTELDELKALKNWNSVWKEVIKEDSIGNAEKSILFPGSSGNLIHHSYHMAKYLDCFNSDLNDHDLIFEFGGGYGNMCKLNINKLGYKGKYVIFDFPELTYIQEYYLKSLGNSVSTATKENPDFSEQICCIHEMDFIQELIKDYKNPLFIGTWSLSETSQAFRDSFHPILEHFKNFLFAYQEVFEGVDNISYFKNLSRQLPKEIHWEYPSIPHLNGSKYCFGKNK